MPGYQRGIWAREIEPVQRVPGMGSGSRDNRSVGPAKAGAHNHRPRLLKEAVSHLAKAIGAWGYRSRIGARCRSLVRDDGGGFAGAVARLRFDFQTAGGMRPRSRGSMRPRFASISPTFGEEGAGKAGCRLHPWVPCKESTGVGPQVNRRHPGFPCAMGYGLLRALPGDRAFLPPSSAGCFPRT
jgi:hypothetical protein